jgi:hypothetical protein
MAKNQKVPTQRILLINYLYIYCSLMYQGRLQEDWGVAIQPKCRNGRNARTKQGYLM